MDIITIKRSNIEEEHICFAITEKKGENCVGSKKAWLKERFKDGLVFKKKMLEERFLLNISLVKNALAPIEGNDFMYINCLWVSGKYKGQGYTNVLLDECIEYSKSKGKKGLVARKKCTFYLTLSILNIRVLRCVILQMILNFCICYLKIQTIISLSLKNLLVWR